MSTAAIIALLTLCAILYAGNRRRGVKWKMCLEHHATEHGDVRSVSLLRIVTRPVPKEHRNG